MAFYVRHTQRQGDYVKERDYRRCALTKQTRNLHVHHLTPAGVFLTQIIHKNPTWPANGAFNLISLHKSVHVGWRQTPVKLSVARLTPMLEELEQFKAVEDTSNGKRAISTVLRLLEPQLTEKGVHALLNIYAKSHSPQTIALALGLAKLYFPKCIHPDCALGYFYNDCLKKPDRDFEKYMTIIQRGRRILNHARPQPIVYWNPTWDDPLKRLAKDRTRRMRGKRKYPSNANRDPSNNGLTREVTQILLWAKKRGVNTVEIVRLFTR